MNYKQAKIADSAKVAKETVLVGNIIYSTVLHSNALRRRGVHRDRKSEQYTGKLYDPCG